MKKLTQSFKISQRSKLCDKHLSRYIVWNMWVDGGSLRYFERKGGYFRYLPKKMRQIADYIWFSRTIEGAGEVGRGAQVFAAKKCGVCHDDPASGAPSLQGLTANGKYFSGASMVSALTRHGPAMLDKMREKHVAWPRFSTGEMSSLIAYLNTRSQRSGR